jgi:hypothetical protein
MREALVKSDKVGGFKDHRFSVAPMMDWTGTSQKAKRNQHLSVVAVSRAVPNAVPIAIKSPHECAISCFCLRSVAVAYCGVQR